MSGIEDLSPADQAAHRLGTLLKKNPDIFRKAQRLAKEADPSLRIPEIELEDQIAAGKVESDKRFEAIEAENIKLRVAQRKTERDAQCRNAGFEPEKIEKIIDERKCSYETAIHIATLEQQTAAPTAGDVRSGSNPPGTPIDMRPQEEFKKVGMNRGALQRLSADIAHGMIDENVKARRQAAR
jgi:hypothetical protein